MKHQVAIGFTAPSYCTEPPFHPSSQLPEFPGEASGRSGNAPYELLRRLLARLQFDAANIGSAAWNPFGGFISPGQTVVIKPNFVLGRHARGGELFSIITHPSILRATADYAWKALRGEGRIVIADAPQMDCRWDELMRAVRLDAVQEFFATKRKFNLEVLDLRNFEMVNPDEPAYAGNRRPRPGDPAGFVDINLGRESAFYGLDTDSYYGADFDRSATIAAHHGETQRYRVSKTILDADVFISVPKLKTHKKVGVTLNLKGLVGINTDKNCLVHYRLGPPSAGGDQHPDQIAASDHSLIRLQRKLYDLFLAKQSRLGDAVYRAARATYRTFVRPFVRISNDALLVDGGNWHGNDSAWRMTSDLAKIIYRARPDGTLAETKQRKFFSIVDGITGGEGEGPLVPDAKKSGCLIAGENLLAVDLAAARCMGFDVEKIRQFSIIADAANNFGLQSRDHIEALLDAHSLKGADFFASDSQAPNLRYAPHPGWTGKIELDAAT